MTNLVKVKIVVNRDFTLQVVIELAANPSTFIDIHTFDGKYDSKFEFKYDTTEKIKKFEKMKNEMKELNVNMENISGVDLIIQNINNPSNHDTINNLIADDILARIVELLEYHPIDVRYSVYKMIIEDMNEMILLGPCSQGRCTRLFDIYRSMH